jgi:hypothetical protein
VRSGECDTPPRAICGPMPHPVAFCALAVAAIVLLPGCRRSLTGAVLTPSSSIPSGALVASYSPTGCTDGSDRVEHRVVDHLRDPHGASMLVERADAPSWLVIRNTFVDGSLVVFQAIQESSQPKTAWEYRVPADGRGSGTFRSSNAFEVEYLPGGVFRATLFTELNRCSLAQVDPMTGRVAASASSPVLPAAPVPPQPFASGGDEPKSWGYDGKSFKVGDKVLVDQGSRSVVAVVLQSNGDQYFVHIEGTPQGSGVWMAPWRVTGRLHP